MNKLYLLAAAAGAAALVTACGGGGAGAVADTHVPGTDVPLAATQDANAAFDFVAGVAANKDDTSEPLVIGDANLATTDTDESRPL